MNRAERRLNADVARELKQDWMQKPYYQRLEALYNAGILVRDLKHIQITAKEYKEATDKAWEDGRLAGIDGTYQICFAAACLALIDLHGFDRKQCYDVMDKMQRHVLDSLTSIEAVNEVFDRIGLELDFSSYQPVRMVDDDA